MDQEPGPGRQIIVGRVRSPRGLRGEVHVEVTSDTPERFSPGGVLFLNGRAHKIRRVTHLPKGRLALKLEGLNTRDEAETLRDSLLTVPEEIVPPLPGGEYYHYQIIDMEVYTQEGGLLGLITDILSTGSNDVYVVSQQGQQGKEVLIPALDDVIVSVDVNRGRMTVKLPEGL